MSYFFDVYGPYEIERHDGEVCRAGQPMWTQAEEQAQGLQRAWGCYLFCIDHGQTITPYYVGKTTAQGGFRDEVFGDHKLEHYNSIAHYKGKRQMLLFPLMTGDRDGVGSFRKSQSGKSAVEWLERTLIGMALARNPEYLLNARDTRFPKSVTVRGLMGGKIKGRPHEEVQYARRALGVG